MMAKENTSEARLERPLRSTSGAIHRGLVVRLFVADSPSPGKECDKYDVGMFDAKHDCVVAEAEACPSQEWGSGTVSWGEDRRSANSGLGFNNGIQYSLMRWAIFQREAPNHDHVLSHSE